MATYKLGFYGFGELAPTGGAGHGAFIPVASAGEQFRLSGPRPSLTPILIAISDAAGGSPVSGDARARIAPGSDFGVEGQPVDVECGLTLVGDGATPRELTCHVLSLEGIPVGLLSARLLQPGVTYTVTRAAAAYPIEDIEHVLRSLDVIVAAKTSAATWEAVFCFTFGTLVDTPEGPRRIEDLVPQDLVTTLGNGSQPLRWTGSRHVPLAEMLASPDLQPVEFAIGTLGNLRPLRVSPQHRILLNDWRAQVYFGEDEVLIPAKAMINGRTIRRVLPPEGVTYIHLLFDRHEIIVSEGALSESFHPGETGLLALDEAQRREVERLFPGLELSRRRAAFPMVKLTEAAAIRLPD